MCSLRYILLLLISLVLCCSCGFHLNGIGKYNNKIPVNNLYLQCDKVILCKQLADTIKQRQLANLVTDPSQANAIIKLSDELTDRRALNYNVMGRVSAYTLSYQVTMQVWQNNKQISNDVTISVQENMQYTDSLILASNQEEARLWNLLHQRAINTIINHLIYFKYQL